MYGKKDFTCARMYVMLDTPHPIAKVTLSTKMIPGAGPWALIDGIIPLYTRNLKQPTSEEALALKMWANWLHVNQDVE